jgi:hypothetical protein
VATDHDRKAFGLYAGQGVGDGQAIVDAATEDVFRCGGHRQARLADGQYDDAVEPAKLDLFSTCLEPTALQTQIGAYYRPDLDRSQRPMEDLLCDRS